MGICETGCLIIASIKLRNSFHFSIFAASDPVCSMTPNAPTDLLYNQTVQMSCRITYTANSYVSVDMIWSKGNPATIVTSANPQTNTSANLTTARSTIIQTPGYSSPFPIYICNTTFKITGNPSGSAYNAPDYSQSIPLFNSRINVICKYAQALTGSKFIFQ